MNIHNNNGAKKIVPRSKPLNSKGFNENSAFKNVKRGVKGGISPNNKSLSRSYIVTTAKAFSLFGG